MRVLVVDDSPVMRKMLIRALGLFDLKNLSVKQAQDGHEALRKALENEYDLILMDWNMPGKVLGIDVVRSLRAHHMKVPIIMVTSECDYEHVVAAVKAGANDYLIKPFSHESFYKKLRPYIKEAPALEPAKSQGS